MAQMFRKVREHLGDPEHIILSAHCHDDLGLAVANSLAAVRAGVRQIECTVNGIGERAGNAALEEVAVALAVRKESFGVATKLKLDELYKSSRLLTEITGAVVAPNKAVVGANAFAHEAGIHQDGIIKNPLTYEIISPEAVGVPSRSLVLGKHSGRHALRESLKELGYEPSDERTGGVLPASDDVCGCVQEGARAGSDGHRARSDAPQACVASDCITRCLRSCVKFRGLPDEVEKENCASAGRWNRAGSDARGGERAAGMRAGISAPV